MFLRKERFARFVSGCSHLRLSCRLSFHGVLLLYGLLVDMLGFKSSVSVRSC